MTQEGTRTATDARPHRREPEAPHAPAALPPEGEALAAKLPGLLREFGVSIDAAIDEVVCVIKSSDVVPVCRRLKDDPALSFKYLRLLSVVDYVEQAEELEVVYHLYSLEHHHKMMLKTRVPQSRPQLDSVTGVWRGANWYEREMHDLFGVRFRGHPDPRTLILPEDFKGHPGLKSYPLHEYDEW